MSGVCKLGLFFIVIILFLGVQSCHETVSPSGANAFSEQIKQQIANGKRLEGINNDSISFVAKELYLLNKQSGDKEALVYAELYEATYLWQSADHKRAMELAVKSRSDAGKFGIKRPLSRIYALIGNLDKETSNYNMAFIAADSGVLAAENIKDTASIISLLGLKAMFLRGFGIKFNKPAEELKGLQLYRDALKIAESDPKYERLRIRFYDNMALYYKDKDEFDSTFYYGNKGVELALKDTQQRSLTYSYTALGMAYYNQGDHVKGINYLNKAMQIARALKEPYRVMEIYESLFRCYSKGHDYKNASDYGNIWRNMRDSLKILDNVKQISELQIKYETAQKDHRIASLNAKSELDNLELFAAIVALVLLAAMGLLFYKEEKKGRNLAIAEKQLLDTDLKNATLELQYFTENMKQKNEIIEEFKSKIDHLHLLNVNKSDMDDLDGLVKTHIMTDESWDKFRRLFERVHVRFFDILKKRFPDLTDSDIRILSLIKLKLSNYEMANMLGVTSEGVRKSKQRLRKKMNLERDDVLELVIATI